jgi:hypothetical protein
MVVKFSGALLVLIEHALSRKVVLMTQYRLFPIAQSLRTIGPRRVVVAVREVR